jgi:hypothetical protein
MYEAEDLFLEKQSSFLILSRCDNDLSLLQLILIRLKNGSNIASTLREFK